MNYFNNNLKLTISGSSHSNNIVLTCYNLPKLMINQPKINEYLKYRRGLDAISTERREMDQYEITQNDNELKITVYNQDVIKTSFDGTVRPGHADLTQYVKYQNEESISGGGISSGRMTVPFIILGALIEDYLNDKGIIVRSFIKKIGNINFKNEFNDNLFTQKNDYIMLQEDNKKELLIKYIEEVKEKKDSLSGEIITYAKCPYIGLGEPYFNSMESLISHLMFSIPGINGIYFGDAFNDSLINGSTFNDIPYYNENKELKYRTNHAGGLNGGLTNSNVITFTTSIKPTSSIKIKQDTINIKTKENTKIEISSRNDPCIAVRALHVINACTYIVLMDQYIGRIKNE